MVHSDEDLTRKQGSCQWAVLFEFVGLWSTRWSIVRSTAEIVRENYRDQIHKTAKKEGGCGHFTPAEMYGLIARCLEENKKMPQAVIEK